MELREFFQLESYEADVNSKEISSPNNRQYEEQIENLEEKIVRIALQKQKAYQDAAEVFIY